MQSTTNIPVQSLTMVQKKTWAKSPSTSACARIANTQSSASRTLPANPRSNLQISVPMKTWFSSSEASACFCPSFNAFLSPCKTQKSLPHPLSLLTQQKSVGVLWMHSPNTTWPPVELETYPRITIKLKNDYNKPSTHKQQSFCTCTCFP